MKRFTALSDVSHLTRVPWPWDYALIGPSAICGAQDPQDLYTTAAYYMFLRRRDVCADVCPECVAALTPLDELASTEL